MFAYRPGARENNLQNITARFPSGKFIAVTGGLWLREVDTINSILKAIAQKLNLMIQINLESLNLSQD